MSKWLKLIIISISLLLLDGISKYLTQKYIPKTGSMDFFYPYGGLGVFKDFFGVSLSLNYVQNEGAAWGSFAKYSTLLFYIRIVIVSSLIAYLIFIDLPFKKIIPYWLVITGAIGNILDHIFYGHVVDMIHFVFRTHSFAVFNLADAMITCGIIFLIFSSFPVLKKRKNEH